jgi:hypothetical protein
MGDRRFDLESKYRFCVAAAIEVLILSCCFNRSIQMGRIPVFMHQDQHWAPYHNTNLSATNFGFVVGLNNTEIENMVTSMRTMTDAEYSKRIELLKDARYVLICVGAILSCIYGIAGTTIPLKARCISWRCFSQILSATA